MHNSRAVSKEKNCSAKSICNKIMYSIILCVSITNVSSFFVSFVFVVPFQFYQEQLVSEFHHSCNLHVAVAVL